MDIASRAHIELLVNTFYEKVRTDNLLAPRFAHVDWPHHMPVMYNFWCSMMLDEKSYQGNPFQKHMPLALEAAHFERWLTLFRATVDELFKGEKAEEIKMRAQSIGMVWQHKLGLLIR
ncbi:MAG: group III truncated hemoglobin [Bacteroidota bacterium]